MQVSKKIECLSAGYLRVICVYGLDACTARILAEQLYLEISGEISHQDFGNFQALPFKRRLECLDDHGIEIRSFALQDDIPGLKR